MGLKNNKSSDSKALFENAKEFIQSNDGFLLSTHINPDGDGLGASLALGWLLTKLDKTYIIAVDGQKPAKFEFMKGYGDIRSLSPELAKLVNSSCKNMCITDSPNLNRIGKIRELIPEPNGILNVDHHISNEMFGSSNLVIAQSSSSSEIVYKLIKSFEIPLEKSVAEYIYAGICVDTGRFHFSSTSSDTFRIAAELVEAGVEPSVIGNALYFENHPATLNGLGVMLNTMEIYENGKIACAVLNHQLLQSKPGKQMDTEGFVNYPLSISGVDASFLLHESNPNEFRVSLRSKSQIDVNVVANVFGGGGHTLAAGCRIEGTFPEVKERLLEEIRKQYKDGD